MAAQEKTAFDIEAFARRQVELVEPGEPVFVLTGRDRQAPALIRQWCNGRAHEIRVGLAPKSDQAVIDEARAVADAMERWRTGAG